LLLRAACVLLLLLYRCVRARYFTQWASPRMAARMISYSPHGSILRSDSNSLAASLCGLMWFWKTPAAFVSRVV